MAHLKRLSIPALKSRNMKIGREGQLIRSWPVAPGEFFRIYRDEPLHLEAEFRNDHPSPKITLHTNLLGGAADDWTEIEFKRRTARHFSVSVPPARCGIFLFKIKHSPDNGKSWFWDRVPFSKVVVDTGLARDIRMYTLLPTVSGTIKDWKKALHHIKGLGFNMVHLLPITRMDLSESPYAASDLFDIDPSFLDPADKRDGLAQFEEFVEEARGLGIRLCMDLVLNHIGITSELAKLCPEWIAPDKNEEDGLLRAGCWHMNKWIKWGDLARINYDHPEAHIKKDLWDYMKQYARFWANYAAYTGGMIRLDNLHSSHPGFISELLCHLRESFPELVIQAEFFSDSNTLLKTASECELNLLLANPWEHPFAEDLRDYLLYLHDISSKLRFLTPMATHDTGTPAQLYGSTEAIVPRYFAVALMATGQTGLVQGNEHGALERTEFIGRSRQVDFPAPNRYNEAIRKINLLLENHALFHAGGNLRFVDNKHGAVLAAVREEGKRGGERFLLVANMDIRNTHRMTVDLTGLRARNKGLLLTDALTGKKIEVKVDALELEIEPCGIRAYAVENQ